VYNLRVALNLLDESKLRQMTIKVRLFWVNGNCTFTYYIPVLAFLFIILCHFLHMGGEFCPGDVFGKQKLTPKL